MISRTITGSIKTAVNIDLNVYLLVVFLTLSPILSFMGSYGVDDRIIYALIAILLYTPLFIGIITKSIRFNKFCLALFACTFLYVVICARVLVEFNEVYSSETNGIHTRIITFVSSFFGLLFFGIHYDEKVLKKGLTIAAYCNLIISFFRFFLVTIRGNEFLTYGYDMNFGYTLLFPLLCFMSLFVLERKRIYLFVSLISFVFVLLFGSRGPILCVGIYLVLLLLFVLFRKQSTHQRVLTLSIIGFLGLAAFLLLNYVVPLFDLSSLPRSLKYILRVDYFSSSTDSGRKIIVEDLSYYLNNIPFFGYGLLADQGFLGVGKYSHNIFLEMWLTFGPVISVTIMVFLLALSLKVFFDKQTSLVNKLFFITLWAFSFGRLLVSNSFWYETYFWCLISFGLCITSRSSIDEKLKQEKLYL